MSKQANLQWIQQEWRKWVETERARKISPNRDYKVGVEHVAKLFAAHCLESLHRECLVDDELNGTDTVQFSEALKSIIDACVTDADTCCICKKDVDGDHRHSKGCPVLCAERLLLR
jgi:hypothetical protein